MEAVAWSAIGVLAATLGVFTAALLHLSSRIQALGDGLRSAIEEQGRTLNARIDALAERIDGQSARIDAHVERHAG
jgi:hypothetical protein